MLFIWRVVINEGNNSCTGIHYIMEGVDQMLTEKVSKEELARKLYRKLALVEIERELIKIPCSLMEDDVYTVDDAVCELIKIIDLIEMERQGIVSEMGIS